MAQTLRPDSPHRADAFSIGVDAIGSDSRRAGRKFAVMPWTITRLCIDCIDTGCVSVCPVDCIYEYVGDDNENFPNMLYIHPDECIDCGACEPECPWQAIFG